MRCDEMPATWPGRVRRLAGFRDSSGLLPGFFHQVQHPAWWRPQDYSCLVVRGDPAWCSDNLPGGETLLPGGIDRRMLR